MLCKRKSFMINKFSLSMHFFALASGVCFHLSRRSHFLDTAVWNRVGDAATACGTCLRRRKAYDGGTVWLGVHPAGVLQ